MTRYLIPILTVLVLISAFLLGCGSVPPSEPTPEEASKPTPALSPTPTPETYIYTRGTIVVGGDGEPIELINNPTATNPTYAQLLAFIEKDQTDKYSYIFGPPKVAYTCGDFAEDVHNNAESAGIRAAWVGIDVYGKDEGHACNAFETTDMGLVFIDCTGEGLWSESSSNRNSWDRQAFVKIGEEYAVSDIDQLKSNIRFSVGIEEYIDEVQELKEWKLRSPEIIEWLHKYDIGELGQEWMQDWMSEHALELSKCGRILEPMSVYHAQSSMGPSENHFVGQSWLVRTDCIDVSWFETIREVIDVDGMPVTWRVSGGSYRKPVSLGIVEDIHLHW